MKTIIFYLGLFALIACGQVSGELDALNKNDDGLKAMNEGDYEKAVYKFKLAINNTDLSNDTKATLYRNLSLAYSELQEIDSSIYYSKLAAGNYKKGSYTYLINIADANLMSGEVPEALTLLNKAYDLNPKGLEVNNLLGLVYLGEYGEEYTNLEKALTHNKIAFEANRDRTTEDLLAQTLYLKGDYSNAELHYKNLAKRYHQLSQYQLNLGMTKYKMGKEKDAEKIFRELTKTDSTMGDYIEEFKQEQQ